MALEGNYAPTPCSLPCVTVDARPPVDNTVLVVVFSQTSVVAWDRTWDGSYDLHCLP